MEKVEIEKVAEVLRENNFHEIVLSENLDDLENYFSAFEIARKLDVRLLNDEINQIVKDLGLKTYVDGVAVPSSPENSAFCIKSVVDDETLIKKYYIQCLWDQTVIDNINDLLAQSEDFQQQKPELLTRNEQLKSEIVSEFGGFNDFVAVVVKKTGFNEEKDFVVYVSYAEIKNGQLVNNVVLPINDDLNADRQSHYYKKDDLTNMSPYDFIKVDLPQINGEQSFLNRKDALKTIYRDFKGKNIVFYNKEESRFIQKMFIEEGIPEEHCYKSIIQNHYGLKDLVDWLDPKQSLKLRNVYDRYEIAFNKTEDKYLFESKRLARLIYKVKKISERK